MTHHIFVATWTPTFDSKKQNLPAVLRQLEPSLTAWILQMWWYHIASKDVQWNSGWLHILGGGFKYFLCLSLPGEMIELD